MSDTWTSLIFSNKSPDKIWQEIFHVFHEKALAISSASLLHNETVSPDRYLSESAWELWQEFPKVVERTSSRLDAWTNEGTASTGKAVLILDALSLRELYVIAEAAKTRNITLSNITVTGSECPSSTNEFAKAIGAAGGRSILANNKKPHNFIPFDGNCFTDVYQTPFEDCGIPPEKKIFIWHSWLDDQIHLNKLPDVLEGIIRKTLQSDGFWSFIDKLRTGRKLVITADHGYAVSKNFSSQIEDHVAVEILRHKFGASRYKAATQPEVTAAISEMIPPIIITHNNQNVIIGQNKWKVQGGAPFICHGGMTILESLVPWIELEAL
jgi:hypothetical protein